MTPEPFVVVIWMIGMSGAGKTTLGREVAKQWRRVAPNCVLLDGDEVREVFRHEGAENYSIAGRRLNAERLTGLCTLLDRQGINVVCCILSIFPDMRAENRSRFSRYFEVFLDAPLSVLKARDTKGLYAAAEAGEARNVVGVDIPFERPTTADMVVDTADRSVELSRVAAKILARAGVAA